MDKLVKITRVHNSCTLCAPKSLHRRSESGIHNITLQRSTFCHCSAAPRDIWMEIGWDRKSINSTPREFTLCFFCSPPASQQMWWKQKKFFYSACLRMASPSVSMATTNTKSSPTTTRRKTILLLHGPCSSPCQRTKKRKWKRTLINIPGKALAFP